MWATAVRSLPSCGSVANFTRYSDALKSSGIIWDDRSLDEWLTDPEAMVPDNDMPFAGIKAIDLIITALRLA